MFLVKFKKQVRNNEKNSLFNEYRVVQIRSDDGGGCTCFKKFSCVAQTRVTAQGAHRDNVTKSDAVRAHQVGLHTKMLDKSLLRSILLSSALKLLLFES